MARLNITLRGRIFFSMLLIIGVSFLLTGTISFYHFKQENEHYHEERLRRKEFAVLEAINFFLRDQQISGNTDSIVKLFDTKVCELAQINGLDINIYGLNGNLLIASAPALHEQEIIPVKIPYDLMERLYKTADQVLTRPETDSLQFLSTFDFIRNVYGKPVAIVNLPYFDSDDIGREDLEDFLLRLSEIYFFLFITAGFLAYFLSNYITGSLHTIAEHIRNTRIEDVNKPLHWRFNDEIGALVEEYNRMLEELHRSAVKLAETERETAWREMAKQVAHEIKNPLTPMRLNVQYLAKSLKVDEPEKLAEFSQSMIDQIDTLSSIASAFSRFATMPKLKMELFSLEVLIKRVTSLYPQSSVSFSSESKNIEIYADPEQLIRVMNNLINNALQAVPEERIAKVEVLISKVNLEVLIEVSDNGEGIPIERQQKIFEPRFTTKSKGMGLGLALVKRIIDSFGGRIGFETQLHKGTIFRVFLPLHAPKEN
jgi:two-component system nitrogen regulation sensor histidine kinase NtrY